MVRSSDRFISLYAALLTRIRFDDAGVHGKAFTHYQAGVHAATQHCIEQSARQITVPKTAVSIFGKGRVVGDFVFKAQPAEPVIRQVQWASSHNRRSEPTGAVIA